MAHLVIREIDDGLTVEQEALFVDGLTDPLQLVSSRRRSLVQTCSGQVHREAISPGPQRLNDALGNELGLVSIGVREDHRELVPADSCECVRLAHGMPQRTCDGFE